MDGAPTHQTSGILADLDRWRDLFAVGRGVFAGLMPGARVGLLPRADAEALAGTMLVWEAAADGMRARLAPFDGYEGAGVDLLFIPEPAALETLYGDARADPLGTMKALVREGAMIFFVMRTGKELRERGYEDFLESLGLAFLGACR